MNIINKIKKYMFIYLLLSFFLSTSKLYAFNIGDYNLNDIPPEVECESGKPTDGVGCTPGETISVNVGGTRCTGVEYSCVAEIEMLECKGSYWVDGKCDRYCAQKEKYACGKSCRYISRQLYCQTQYCYRCKIWKPTNCRGGYCANGSERELVPRCTRYVKKSSTISLPAGTQTTVKCGERCKPFTYGNYTCTPDCDFSRRACPTPSSCRKIYCIDPDLDDPQGTYVRLDSETSDYNNKYPGLAYILKYESQLGSFDNAQKAIYYYLNAMGAIENSSVPTDKALEIANRAIELTRAGSLKTAGNNSNAITVEVDGKEVGSTNITPQLITSGGDESTSIETSVIRISGTGSLNVSKPVVTVPEGFVSSIIVTEQTSSSYGFKIHIDYQVGADLEKLKEIKATVSASIDDTNSSDILVPMLVIYGPKNGNAQRTVDIVNAAINKTIDINFSPGMCDYDARFPENMQNKAGCCSDDWINTFIQMGKVSSRDEFMADHPECGSCVGQKGADNSPAICDENITTASMIDLADINSECVYSDDFTDDDASSYYHNIPLRNSNYCKMRCVESLTMNFPSAPLNRITDKERKDIPGYTVKAGYFVWPNTQLTFGYFGDKSLNTVTSKSCRIMVDRLGLRDLAKTDSAAASSELQKCYDALGDITSQNLHSTDVEFSLSYEYDKEFIDSINKNRGNIKLDKYNEIRSCSFGTINNTQIDESPDACNNLARIKTTGNLETDISRLRNYQFDIVESTDYKIPDYVNAYVDFNGIPHDEASNNYSPIGYGNIPLGFRKNGLEFYQYTDEKGTYDRTIAGNVRLDYVISGHFGSLSGDTSSYICRFEATKYIGETYSCSVDTAMPNYPITDCVKDKLKNESSTTLEGAKAACSQKLCNAYTCPEGTYGAGRDLTEEIKERAEQVGCEVLNSECRHDVLMALIEEGKCDGDNNPPGEKYYCPSCSTNPKMKNCSESGPNDTSDITACVKSEMAKGFNLERAINNCETVMCPYEAGRVVIYRPIVYENPFPSISATSADNQSTNLGRIPGANWRNFNTESTDARDHHLVKTYILENRETDEKTPNEVYNKTPLYKFVITRDNIKSIRDASKAEVYDILTEDAFTCQLHGRACISNIVHTYNLSGTCSNLAYGSMGQYDAYYECVGRTGR